MTVLFDHFTLRIWRSLFMVYLDNWSMLNLIQTNKLMNKNNKYVYMIIFQSITTMTFTYHDFSLNYASYKLVDYTNTYKKNYYIYTNIYLNNTIFIYNINNLKLLVKNNSNLRKMLEKYLKGRKIGTNNYKVIDSLIPIQ
jgi:hypothetical protein